MLRTINGTLYRVPTGGGEIIDLGPGDIVTFPELADNLGVSVAELVEIMEEQVPLGTVESFGDVAVPLADFVEIEEPEVPLSLMPQTSVADGIAGGLESQKAAKDL